ncbi:flippase-like domain-containing protein [Paraburkholderia adhaesiva]|uniref:flippase-like domain-containing protein n=1 Tax=Paraburkholderia adhaesiva TaxID=2883244 RepID=UPI001F3FA598|nr:flippase-like domain-containing protein [Paraburkholderia adhaesiva]
MKGVGGLAALAGAGLALWLLWREDPRAVLAALHAAGWGLVLAALIHVLHILSNGRAWQILFERVNRPSYRFLFLLTWIRESVNSLLPVIRVGGDIEAFRLLLRRGVPVPLAASSLIVDTQLTVISQLMFTIVGIGFLFGHGKSGNFRLAGELALGVAVLAPLLAAFALIQHANPFERVTRVLNRMLSGKLVGTVTASWKVDEAIKAIWRRRGAVIRYLFFWQPLHYTITSLEIWTALFFLGARVTFVEALVIESLIQALSSAAFFVPGAVGVQEGGFIVIGGALGLDPAICLALAGARRIRDLVIFVPGLLAWQAAEAPQVPGGLRYLFSRTLFPRKRP